MQERQCFESATPPFAIILLPETKATGRAWAAALELLADDQRTHGTITDGDRVLYVYDTSNLDAYSPVVQASLRTYYQGLDERIAALRRRQKVLVPQLGEVHVEVYCPSRESGGVFGLWDPRGYSDAP